jgi:uncharacterized PurR-regulated membrane protein YhhQ (DUF165 family)
VNPRTISILAAYMGTIPAANLLVTHAGAVPVWPGLAAPAGVYMVGIALILRDFAHEQAGRNAVLAAIGVGTVLSYLLADPAVATASAAAFGVAELADTLVYGPLRRRGLVVALLASNTVGLVADSLIFLKVAFGDLGFLWGQILGKAWMTVLAAALLAGWVAHRRGKNPPDLEPCGCGTVKRLLCGHCRHDQCEDCGTCAGAGHPVHECKALA